MDIIDLLLSTKLFMDLLMDLLAVKLPMEAALLARLALMIDDVGFPPEVDIAADLPFRSEDATPPPPAVVASEATLSNGKFYYVPGGPKFSWITPFF